MANPPFAAPDEGEHYIRTLGVSEGHLIDPPDAAADIGVTPKQVRWTRQATRLVAVPAGLDPRPFSCATGPGQLSAACVNFVRPDRAAVSLPTAVGNYQPLPYLLPAAVVRAASSPPAALRLARAAGALSVMALLAVALLALFDGAYPLLSIVGLMLAVTPMALFVGASLTGSDLEVAGSIAFFACLLRAGRPGAVGRRWWAAGALSGAVLALSRVTGPAWLLVALCVALAWGGPRSLLSRWAHERAAWVAGGVLLVAVCLNRVWEGLYGSHVELDTSQLHAGLVGGFHEWRRALPELIGKFGYLDVKLPLVLPVLWFALVIGLCVGACIVAQRLRERLLIIAAVAGALVLPPVFYALLIRPTGYGLQGRQVLAALVIVPLLVGELSYRHRDRWPAAIEVYLLPVVLVGVAIVQVGAWWVDAGRFASGSDGPVWFPAHAQWAPPTGWALWVAAVLLAGIALVVGALTSARQNRGTAVSGVRADRCV
jgi:hypothetical protein